MLLRMIRSERLPSLSGGVSMENSSSTGASAADPRIERERLKALRADAKRFARVERERLAAAKDNSAPP